MPTIVIVDDDPLQCELAFRLLENLPELKPLYASNGEEALKHIENHSVDLVITDLRMPGMSGLDLVGAIRQDWPSLPVILMTAYGSERMAVQALAGGAASYVPKRDLAERLEETVRQVLSVSQSRRRREQIFEHMVRSEIQFELENNPELIPPLIGFFQENLRRLNFGSESTRTHVGMALMEALSNGMIHGNLEVSSATRKESQVDYFNLVEQRRKENPYKSRRLRISARESRERIVYRIQDDGPGFDPESLPDPTSPQNVLRLSGRGLMLIRTFMDTVEFNERGTEVTLTKLKPLPSGSANPTPSL